MLSPLEQEIAGIVLECTGVEHLEVGEIDPEASLFDGELGLDSIDALEIGVALNKHYGIKLSADDDEARAHFATLRTLARLVEDRRVR